MIENKYFNYIPNFLTEKYCEEIENNIMSLDKGILNQKSIIIYGKEVMQPRLTAYFGDVSYKYSGKVNKAQEMPDFIKELSKKLDYEYNAVLVNVYRNGNDYISFHSDDEKEINKQIPIASISIGATRKFIFQDKFDKDNKITLYLKNGDLLYMNNICQKKFKHSIPKEKNVKEQRINLTFRNMLK